MEPKVDAAGQEFRRPGVEHRHGGHRDDCRTALSGSERRRATIRDPANSLILQVERPDRRSGTRAARRCQSSPTTRAIGSPKSKPTMACGNANSRPTGAPTTCSSYRRSPPVDAILIVNSLRVAVLRPLRRLMGLVPTKLSEGDLATRSDLGTSRMDPATSLAARPPRPAQKGLSPSSEYPEQRTAWRHLRATRIIRFNRHRLAAVARRDGRSTGARAERSGSGPRNSSGIEIGPGCDYGRHQRPAATNENCAAAGMDDLLGAYCAVARLICR